MEEKESTIMPYIGESLHRDCLCGLDYVSRDTEYRIDSLADRLRSEGTIPFEVYNFLKGKPACSHHFSSWTETCSQSRTAHASKEGCRNMIKMKTTVLCVTNQNGVLEFSFHKFGNCPYFEIRGKRKAE